jgi:hypothetical protein
MIDFLNALNIPLAARLTNQSTPEIIKHIRRTSSLVQIRCHYDDSMHVVSGIQRLPKVPH